MANATASIPKKDDHLPAAAAMPAKGRDVSTQAGLSATPTVQPHMSAIDTNPSTGKEQSYLSPEWSIVWATLLLAGITGALAAYTARLYRATVRLGEDAKTTSERQANEMARMIEANAKSAEAAKTSADLYQAEFQKSHSPKLVVRRVQAICNPGQTGIEFVMANIGASLATQLLGDLNVVVVNKIEIAEFEKRSIPRYGNQWVDLGSMIQRSTTSLLNTPMDAPILDSGESAPIFIQSPTVSAEAIRQVQEGNAYLYFFGRIGYSNFSATRRHEMRFFRTCRGTLNMFEPKANDPDYEWN